MSNFSRRDFVSILGASTAGLSITPLSSFYARPAHARMIHGCGFGPLESKLPVNTDSLPDPYKSEAFLSLPEQFSYSVASITGEIMSDGHPVPGSHDGMGAFRGCGGNIVVVRNHELNTGEGVMVSDGSYYDATRAGGTTTLEFDQRGRLQAHYGSLAGTERNCAGGPTPWDTWLTCEETFSTGDERHGYVFEVPSDGLADPTPIRAMGRFNHEAAAVDPRTGYIYLTEDRGDSVFYRYRPHDSCDLRAGGVLEALRLLDFPEGINTKNGFLDHLYEPFAVDWVIVDEVDPDSESDGNSTRSQAQAKGAAVFSRGEGAWYGNQRIYFCCTNGGEAGKGQVWAYHPRRCELTLFVEAQKDPENPDLEDNGGFLVAAPDNICVAPDGRLYLCEDGSGVEKVVGVDRDGSLFEFARNVYNNSEFAGVCFCPRGRLMFVNLQNPGLTLVIHGPWRRRA